MLQAAWTQLQIPILHRVDFPLTQREVSIYGNPTLGLKKLLQEAVTRSYNLLYQVPERTGELCKTPLTLQRVQLS